MVMCTFSYNDQWSIMLSRAFFYTVLADMLMPNHQGSLCHSYSKCSKKPTKAISTSLSNQITCQRRPSHLNLTKAPTFAKPETGKNLNSTCSPHYSVHTHSTRCDKGTPEQAYLFQPSQSIAWMWHSGVGHIYFVFMFFLPVSIDSPLVIQP